MKPVTERTGSGPWVGLGQINSSDELLERLRERARDLTDDPQARLALSQPDGQLPSRVFNSASSTRPLAFRRLVRGAGGAPRAGSWNPLVADVTVVAEADDRDLWRARATWAVHRDPAWRAAARQLEGRVRADRARPTTGPDRAELPRTEGRSTMMVRIGRQPVSVEDLGLRLVVAAPKLSNDRRVRRALARPDGFADEFGKPVVPPELDVAGGETRLRYGSVVREKSGRPVGGRHLPLVCHVDVTLRRDASGEWWVGAEWDLHRNPNWRSVAKRPAREPNVPRVWQQISDIAPTLARGLDVAEVSAVNSGTDSITMRLRTGEEVLVLLAFGGMPNHRSLDTHGALISLAANGGHPVWSDIPTPAMATKVGQKRAVGLALTKVLAPHVARARGFDEAAYTDRALIWHCFQLYHQEYVHGDKPLRRLVRKELLGALDRERQRRHSGDGALPDDELPLADVAKHYDSPFRRALPGFFDAPPVVSDTFGGTAAVGLLDVVPGMIGAAASTDSNQTIRFLASLGPSWIQSTVGSHVTFTNIGWGSLNQGPLDYALTRRYARYFLPDATTGSLEANARSLSSMAFGTGHGDVEATIEARRNVGVFASGIANVLDQGHIEHWVNAQLASEVLGRNDSATHFAQLDKYSRGLHWRFNGLSDEQLEQLSNRELAKCLEALWKHHRALADTHALLTAADRKPAAFTSKERPNDSPKPMEIALKRSLPDTAATAAATGVAAQSELAYGSLSVSYLVASWLGAYFFPLQRKAAAADWAKGAEQRAQAEHQTAELERVELLARLVDLADRREVEVPPRLRTHLNRWSPGGVKPWRPSVKPFLIRPMLVLPFTVPAAALPLFWPETEALMWGHLANTAARSPVGGVANWIREYRRVVRGAEYQEVMDQADWRAGFPSDVAELIQLVEPATASVTALHWSLEMHLSLEQALPRGRAMEPEVAKTVRELPAAFAEDGSDQIRSGFIYLMGKLTPIQLAAYLRQQVPNWDELSPSERAREFVDQYTLEFERNVLRLRTAELAWRGADVHLAKEFRSEPAFIGPHHNSLDPGWGELASVICDTSCASVTNGLRLALVLELAMRGGGRRLTIEIMGGSPVMSESDRVDNRRMAELIPVVDKLIEHDIDLLAQGFAPAQIVDERLAESGPMGEARSPERANQVLEYWLANEQYRSDYVAAKQRQLRGMRAYIAATNRGPITLTSPEFDLSRRTSEGETNLFDDPERVREVVRENVADLGFGDAITEVLQCLGHSRSPGELYEVVSGMVLDPAAAVELKQLADGDITVTFSGGWLSEDVSSCVLRLSPVGSTCQLRVDSLTTTTPFAPGPWESGFEERTVASVYYSTRAAAGRLGLRAEPVTVNAVPLSPAAVPGQSVARWRTTRHDDVSLAVRTAPPEKPTNHLQWTYGAGRAPESRSSLGGWSARPWTPLGLRFVGDRRRG